MIKVNACNCRELVRVGGALAQVINEIIPVLDTNEVLGLCKEINKPFEEYAKGGRK